MPISGLPSGPLTLPAIEPPKTGDASEAANTRIANLSINLMMPPATLCGDGARFIPPLSRPHSACDYESIPQPGCHSSESEESLGQRNYQRRNKRDPSGWKKVLGTTLDTRGRGTVGGTPADARVLPIRSV